ncbi:N-acetylmuramoyl-L-alanine amidase family protein [Halanaerobacter jeridensis]|uniref:N-acetylmuramoyl-L-alanine amidase n=1 Tax=Halanaerobacter jeridensis TaxID=706427 RepID=A0A938XQD6_9FIRM|nr:N-acetylmuramoyl-L-alanine amidase [Halanaerobacter jeridensis]MBM7557923.1 N-acetylmuramoyl-L-alanine amidase [Halanaerobacter jeridensis]
MKRIWFLFISINKIFLFLIIIFVISFSANLLINFTNNAITVNGQLNKKVIIDPGHGGMDSGAHHKEILEKNINLAIAKKLAKKLSDSNVQVKLTRNKDKLYQNNRQKDLRHRIKVANTSQADLLISIHVNSFPSSKSFGGETYYSEGSKEGKKLASAIQEQLLKIQPKNYRTIKTAPYYVLEESNITAVLIEVGFISNPQDRKRITNSQEQEKIAEAITTGIINYFNNNLHLLPKKSSSFSEYH